MKKQYIAALACLVAGAIGFVGVYSTERAKEKEEYERVAQVEKETQENKTFETAHVVEPKKTPEKVQQVTETEEESETQTKEPEKKKEEPVKKASVEVEALHFSAEKGISWPIEGKVLMPYCMDSTIYNPTLDQYQCNPAMIIQGDVNSKVCFVADGKILSIEENEETGCTVTEDLGDGYCAVYGQLKDIKFKKGENVKTGQVVGCISEPTKYYSVEGSNLYFKMTKDGEPVDPMVYLK